MKKFIATIAAAALALTIAPSANADVRLSPVRGAVGFEQIEGAIEEVQALSELPVEWFGVPFTGVNCGDRLAGKAFDLDTNPADVIRWFQNNRNPGDPACDVAFTVVKKTTVFPDEEWWFGQNFTSSSPERVSYPLYPDCEPEAEYGDNGEWCYTLKYGNTPYLIDRVSTELPDYTPDYIDECTPWLKQALADRGMSIKDVVRVSTDMSGIYSGKPLACFVQPYDLNPAEPQSDADCADDEMVVPTPSGNVCFPTPIKGDVQGGDNGAFNNEYGNGTNRDWEGIEICYHDYIGSYMKIGDGTPYQEWMKNNMIFDNYNNGVYDDCIQRAVDITGDRDLVGLRSWTTYSPNQAFFTEPVDGEPLCDIKPLTNDNRHAEHCATPVKFWEKLETSLDPSFPDFGFEPGVDPNPEVSVELPTLSASLDYEFVYEQGEAGVCLYPDEGEVEFTENGVTFCGTPVDNPVDVEPIQEWNPPPPECWQGPNNCPVGQSISYAVPEYMMVGVPVNVSVYAIRSVEDELGRFNYGQPDNGTAVIHYGDPDSPPVAGVPFINGEATFRIVPQEAGKKNFSICGVLNSGTTGGNAYIDCVDGNTTVLPYDPETYRKAFKDLVLEKGDKFTIADKDQVKGKIAKRLQWRVAQSDEDVCAVYETKKGKVRAKFNKTGECTVLWEDPKTGESGRIQIGS